MVAALGLLQALRHRVSMAPGEQALVADFANLRSFDAAERWQARRSHSVADLPQAYPSRYFVRFASEEASPAA
jgi:hypothetical protein